MPVVFVFFIVVFYSLFEIVIFCPKLMGPIFYKLIVSFSKRFLRSRLGRVESGNYCLHIL